MEADLSKTEKLPEGDEALLKVIDPKAIKLLACLKYKYPKIYGYNVLYICYG